MSSGLRPPLTGIRISCSTWATELAAGESSKPVLIILEMRHMKLYIDLVKEWITWIIQQRYDEPYEPQAEQAAQDDETFWMI